MRPTTKPVQPGTVERRRSQRRAVSEVVKLELDDGTSADHLGLLVTDVSDGGVRLFARDVILPKTFSLMFPETGIRRECRTVWRIGPEIGLEFVGRRPMTAKKRRSMRSGPEDKRRADIADVID
jgi:hypothetical protein